MAFTLGIVEIGFAKRFFETKAADARRKRTQGVNSLQAFSTPQMHSFDRKQRRNTESQQALGRASQSLHNEGRKGGCAPVERGGIDSQFSGLLH
ncbi:MAG: hypothetical protein Q4A98_03470 [Comamonadaceae bacterium]|nr:hypothetical protein [Comamonadaceae bacterium]